MGNDESNNMPDALARAIARFGNSNQDNSNFRAFPPTSVPSPPPLALRPADSLWFNQKDIVLDGWRFTSCRFDKCRIFLNSQHFELVNCFIDAESVIYYQNNTLSIIQLFNSRFGSNPLLPPHFNAFKNNDGTISIVR
ncbi:hypothetical protein PXN04_03295 [Citrobacter braakii]|uniref:hypothetical protein n=1 Tax=Citrobacter braakii TaxID=57706 RepID=UPI0023A9AD47|nr:hypothetical protein [Citrobacter braakii]WEA80110.1 hypothetical protein PXN04_03295 [Citrobacter braakii]